VLTDDSVPPPEMFPLESIVVLSVIAPVEEFLEICLNPPSALTGPLKVVLAILISS
jgi:hypothetical protein